MTLLPQKPAVRIAVLILFATAIGVFIYFNHPQSVPRYSVGRPFVGQEKELFTFPPKGATAAEQKAHYDLIMSSAVETNSLDIKDCVATPEVLKVKDGSTLNITNSGSAETKFQTSGRRAIIAAGKTVPIPMNFKVKTLSIFTFGCGDPLATHPMGILVVTPK